MSGRQRPASFIEGAKAGQQSQPGSYSGMKTFSKLINQSFGFSAVFAQNN